MTTRTQLAQIATRRERAVLQAFTEVVQSVRGQVAIQEITLALNAGNVNRVIDLLQLDQATYEPLEHAIIESFRTGGLTGASQVGKIPTTQGELVARFNVRAPAAEAWAATMSSRLITEIIDRQRETIRETITEGLIAGRNPRSVALDIVGRIDPKTRKRAGGVIALTERQARWVSNARAELETLDVSYLTRELRDRRFDRSVIKAIQDGKPLTDRQIDAAITQMQNRAERYRAETIARTESINALREGQQQAIKQAFEQSDIQDKEIEREWSSSGGSRTRPDHADADGQVVSGLDEPFIVGGEELRYPGDPRGSAEQTINCRCRVIERINWGGRLRRLEGFA